MKKSVKAALLSALVFPGAGHLFLKKYYLGTALACTSLLSLYFLISGTVERALQIIEKIQFIETQLDLAVMTEILSQQAKGSDMRFMNMIWLLLIFLWIIGIVDSYMTGREKNGTEIKKT